MKTSSEKKILVDELNNLFDSTKERISILRKVSRMHYIELKSKVRKDNLVMETEYKMKHFIGIPLTETRKNGRKTIFKMIMTDSVFSASIILKDKSSCWKHKPKIKKENQFYIHFNERSEL